MTIRKRNAGLNGLAFEGTPWAIRESSLRLMADARDDVMRLALSSNEGVDRRALARSMEEGDSTRGPCYLRRGAVGVVPIIGPIMRYASWWGWLFGGTSYDEIATGIASALDDPDVETIVLEVDSEGGDVNGCCDCGDFIVEANARKPVVAVVTGMACSAAYWLASSASMIVVGETSELGSIGCVALTTDYSQMDAKLGIRTVQVVSSQSPNKRLDPATPEGEASLQRVIDRLADVFVAHVARNRDVSVDTVLADFGQGGTIIGQDAIDAGLADTLGSYESVVASMQPERRMQGALG